MALGACCLGCQAVVAVKPVEPVPARARLGIITRGRRFHWRPPPCRLPRGTLGRTGPSPGPVGLMTGAIGLSVWGDVGYNTPEQAGTWGRRAEAEIILVCRLHINSSTTPIQSLFLSVCFSFAFQSSFARSPLGIPSSPMLV